MPADSPPLPHAKWAVPALSLLLGLLFLAAAAAGGRPVLGLEMLGIMLLVGAAFLLGGRSETVRGLRGDGRDERFAAIDLRATAATGLVLVLAVIGGFAYELARGQDGMPYTWLGFVGGVAYLGAVLWFRLPS